MKSSFVLAALAAPAVLVAPARAETYFTTEQAQAQMMPGKSLTPAFVTLSDAQASAIEDKTGVNVLTHDVKAWRAADGALMFVDEVVGKHEFITFGLALDKTGAVTDVEIMDYRESYGYGVREAAWRAQFIGKRDGAALKIDEDIQNYSGATLSSKHITDGVKRLLATYALVYAHQTH